MRKRKQLDQYLFYKYEWLFPTEDIYSITLKGLNDWLANYQQELKSAKYFRKLYLTDRKRFKREWRAGIDRGYDV